MICFALKTNQAKQICDTDIEKLISSFKKTNLYSQLPKSQLQIKKIYTNLNSDLKIKKNLKKFKEINHVNLNGILLYSKKINGINFYLMLSNSLGKKSKIYQVEANIDDDTPEHIATYVKVLLQNGALDVWVENIVMKKGRSAFKLVLLSELHDLNQHKLWLLQHTSTIGIRFHKVKRLLLYRKMQGDVKTVFDCQGKELDNIEHSNWESEFIINQRIKSYE